MQLLAKGEKKKIQRIPKQMEEKDNSRMEGIKEIIKHLVKAVVAYHIPFHLQSVLGNLVAQVCDIFVSFSSS